jgi:hypothetical protein
MVDAEPASMRWRIFRGETRNIILIGGRIALIQLNLFSHMYSSNILFDIPMHFCLGAICTLEVSRFGHDVPIKVDTAVSAPPFDIARRKYRPTELLRVPHSGIHA